jgi:hypothetical protein
LHTPFGAVIPLYERSGKLAYTLASGKYSTAEQKNVGSKKKEAEQNKTRDFAGGGKYRSPTASIGPHS